jgi:PIN domain nuclease of toxin-antitoxin system
LQNKLLLDTHVAVWVVSSPEKLGPKTRKIVEQVSEVAISSISFAELNIKSMLGGFKLPADLAQRLQNADIQLADFTVKAAEEILRFGSLAKHDPFDRLLLAQASSTGSKFVTADRRLIALGLDFVMDSEV